MKGIFTVFEKDGVEWDYALQDYVVKTVEVYAVRDDKNGYPHFLICENGEWKYKSAKYYTNSVR